MLSPDEQRELLRQGVQDYQSGKTAEAAEKLQRIVDSGVNNDRLYFNLATMYEQSRQVGRAIAGYRSALRFAPENASYQRELASLKQSPLPFVSPNIVRLIFIISWLLFWTSMLVALYRDAARWKIIAVVCVHHQRGCRRYAIL